MTKVLTGCNDWTFGMRMTGPMCTPLQIHTSYEARLAVAQTCELAHVDMPTSPPGLPEGLPPVKLAAAMRQVRGAQHVAAVV